MAIFLHCLHFEIFWGITPSKSSDWTIWLSSKWTINRCSFRVPRHFTARFRCVLGSRGILWFFHGKYLFNPLIQHFQVQKLAISKIHPLIMRTNEDKWGFEGGNQVDSPMTSFCKFRCSGCFTEVSPFSGSGTSSGCPMASNDVHVATAGSPSRIPGFCGGCLQICKFERACWCKCQSLVFTCQVLSNLGQLGRCWNCNLMRTRMRTIQAPLKHHPRSVFHWFPSGTRLRLLRRCFLTPYLQTVWRPLDVTLSHGAPL